jgi:Cd2+/Zn2+-exporting ATPase
MIDGLWVGVGRPELFARRAIELPEPLLKPEYQADGQTRVLIYREDGLGGTIALADEIRPEAAATLQQLRSLGIRRFLLLTGDQAAPAQRVAAALGIEEVRSRLRPEDKLAQIHTLAKTTEGVAMVGDGVNDAPALAAATVGVAMGAAGSDVALENADVVLMRDNLHGLAEAVHLARHCRQTIRISLLIAFGMIALLVLLTLSGLMLLPLAVVGHEGSTVLVVLNGLRLLRQDDVRQHLANAGVTASVPSPAA